MPGSASRPPTPPTPTSAGCTDRPAILLRQGDALLASDLVLLEQPASHDHFLDLRGALADQHRVRGAELAADLLGVLPAGGDVRPTNSGARTLPMTTCPGEAQGTTTELAATPAAPWVWVLMAAPRQHT
jgi:hypothetical protein